MRQCRHGASLGAILCLPRRAIALVIRRKRRYAVRSSRFPLIAFLRTETQYYSVSAGN